MKRLKNDYSEEDIPMDKIRTLDQLTSHFQTVKEGLPEIIKNSKDHYGWLRISNKEDRQIIVIISQNKKDIGVLDFGGASKEDLDHWKIWSIKPRNKNELPGDIEAGHGNGGKAFMVRGCNGQSTICGYINNRINKRGFNPSKKYVPTLIIDNKEDKNHDDILNSELFQIGLNIKDLPLVSQQLFEKRKSFTFVFLKNLKDLDLSNIRVLNRLIDLIPLNISIHAQTAQTIETCLVYVMIGKIVLDSIKLEPLDPYPGFESIQDLDIPEKLIDPSTEEEVEIPHNPQNKLILKTSKKNLRGSENLQGRNVIRVRADRNRIAAWSVAEIAPIVQSGFIYGELKCFSLKEEHQVGSERIHLVDVPLTRSLKHWTSEKVKELSERIHHAQVSSDSTEDIDDISKIIERFREKMKSFLEEQKRKEQKQGITEGTVISPVPPPQPVIFGKRIDKIVLEIPGKTIRVAKGTMVPLIIKCYEVDEKGEEKPVISNNLELYADKEGIIEDRGNNFIRSTKEGQVNIYYKSKKRKKISSNIIKLEVIEIKKIEMDCPTRILKQNELIDLKITPYDKKGKEVKGMIFETHLREIKMGKITRTGHFTSGESPGEVNIWVVYGQVETDIKSGTIHIGEEKMIRTRKTGTSDIPLILVCGRTAPGREELAPEQRTHTGGEEYPTIIDSEPLWPGIIWLNYKSKESQKIRTSKGPFGINNSIKTKNFKQFLALKCFEILKRLKLAEDLGEDSAGIDEFKRLIGSSEMYTADFLDEAFKIVEHLINDKEEEND